MKLFVVFSVPAILACALSSIALASRAPTPAESTAIKAAVAAYIKNPSSHAASDNKVASIRVSTVDQHFAGASLKSVSGNSIALVQYTAKKWAVKGFGPSQSCSLAPKAVRSDLKIICGKS